MAVSEQDTPSISGELKQWHAITLDFAGPDAGETSETFTDFRLDVVFTNADTGTQIKVPGYFAADGDAANTGATSGDVWRVHFTPPETGNWSYEVSFRAGDDVAVSLNDNAGSSAGFMDGATGSIDVTASDKTGDDLRAKGALQYVGDEYLEFAGDGANFIKSGVGSPENLLGYADFDNTRATHEYAPHLADWNAGDPTWGEDGEQGKELIGAINYLASEGVNSIYFLTLTAGGDGQDVWPWAVEDLNLMLSKNETDPGAAFYEAARVFDVSKLAQWDVAFSHMQESGLVMHMLLQETENDQLLNGGDLGLERMLYLREMIARFGHHNGLIYNLGEENSLSPAQLDEQADYIRALDAYDHAVVSHTRPTQKDLYYPGLLNRDAIDGFSLQSSADKIRDDVVEWIAAAEAKGEAIPAFWDEQGTAKIGLAADNDPAAQEEFRKAYWGMLTAGGSGAEWYFGYETSHGDLDLENFRSRDNAYDWAYAARLLFEKLPLEDMSMRDGLTSGTDGADYVIADPGEIYVIYLPEGGGATLDLSGRTGEFDVRWYDPRNGGETQTGSVESVDGGGLVDLGEAPAQKGQDWAILVRRAGEHRLEGLDPDAPAPAPDPTPDPEPEPEPEPDPDPIPAPDGGGEAPITARDTYAFIPADAGWTELDLFANDSDPEGDALAIDSLNTDGALGDLRINADGSVSYRPGDAFEGLAEDRVLNDRFYYWVTDGENLVREVVVTRVEGVAPETGGAPVAADDAGPAIDADAAILFDPLGNDSDPDGDPIAIVAVDGAQTQGLATLTEDGRIEYAAAGRFANLAAGQTVVDTVRYTISDGVFASEAEISFSVTGVGVGGGSGGGSGETIVSTETFAATSDMEQNGDWVRYEHNDVDDGLDDIAIGLKPTGFRFADVAIPDGAVIESAHLTFTAARSSDDASNFHIELEADADAADFADDAGLLDRDYLDASIDWVPEEVWWTGETYDTVDVSALLNDLLAEEAAADETYDLVFRIGGDGKRRVLPEELSGAEPATALTITFSTTDAGDAPAPAPDLNAAPTLAYQAFAGVEDQALSGRVLAADADGDALTFSLVEGGGPANGELTLRQGGGFDYVPDADFFGVDRFWVEVSDGDAVSRAAVDLTIDGRQDAPVAVTSELSTEPGAVLTGQLEAFDLDGEPLRFIRAVGGAGDHGTAIIGPDGTFEYTPNDGFVGVDSFVFGVTDGDASLLQEVFVTVSDPLKARNDNFDVLTGRSTSLDVLANDVASSLGGALELIDLDTDDTLGFVEFDPAGQVVYTPNGAFTDLYAGETLADSFRYRVSDGVESDWATANILVTGGAARGERPEELLLEA